MMTGEEELWLVVYYGRARSLADGALQPVEKRLLSKGLARVRTPRNSIPTDPPRTYVTASATGRAYARNYLLLKLLRFLVNNQNFTEVMNVMNGLPMRKLPELLVSSDDYIRFLAQERMQALKNGTNGPTVGLSHYIS